jgi:PKD repeat protein
VYETVRIHPLLKQPLVWACVVICALGSCQKLIEPPKPACFIPYVDFVAHHVDPNTLEVRFTSITAFNGTITAHEWDFGDGTTFSGPNPPPHRYPQQSGGSNGATYRIKYTVRNECGEAYWTKDISLNRCLPAVNFTFTKLNDSTIRFQNTTTSASPVVYEWKFGDGTTSTSASNDFTKVYRFNGTYTVTLNAVNACGENFFVTTVPVCKKPVPAQQVQVSACGQVSINASTTINGEKYQWDFGNGTVLPAVPSATPTITYTYPSPGQYTIRLKVLNGTACDSAFTSTPVVIQSTSITPNRQWSYVSDDLSFQFSRSTVTGATAYKWVFSDGSTLTGQNVSKQFAAPGSYTVSIIASNACQADSFQQTVSVPLSKALGMPPAIRFRQVVVVSPQQIYFLGENGQLYRSDTAGNWSSGMALPSSLNFNDKTQLFKDVNNQLWIFGRGAVARFNPGSNTWTSFFNTTGYGNNTTIENIAVDASGNLWTVAGGDVRRNSTNINASGNPNFSAIAFAPGSNSIWATAQNRSQLYSVSVTGNSFNTSGIASLTAAGQIMAASNGELFFATGTGIMRASSSGNLLSTYTLLNTNSLLTGRPDDFIVDEEGFIWAVQNNRLLRIAVNGGAALNYSQNSALTNPSSLSLLRLSATDHDLFITKTSGNAAVHVK